MRTAEARLNSARTRLERRRVVSPVAGTVQEVYFRVGEMVQAGRPIVSLLPPGNVRVRFFVPQAMLPQVHIGDRIAVRLRRLRAAISCARVSFISAQAEFTPPVIYSQEERARLVFRVEALPEQAGGPARRPAGVRRLAAGGRCQPCQQMTPATAQIAIEVEGLTKSFGGRVVVRDLSMRVQARPDLRLPRPQRLGQDHHLAHAVRAADARQRPRHRRSATTSARRARRSSATSAT